MQKLLNLKPIPRISHINPWAFIIACVFIAIVAGVLFYTVTSASNHANPTATTEQPLPMAAENDKRWYQAIPNNTVPPYRLSHPSEDAETELSRQEKALLKSAMDSPIKAPMEGVSLSLMKNGNPENHTLQTAEVPASNPTQSIAFSENEKKENFLTQLSESLDEDVLQESLKKPMSPYILQAGTLIPATLTGSINSDLPGQLSALVNQNVYDSIHGRYLLIPQGSKLILIYDANVAYGQQRLLVAVKRIILPNGNSLHLKNMPAVDASGQAGFQDQVDHHYMRLFGSAAMLGMVTGGFQMSQATSSPGNTVATPTVSQVMGNAMGEQMGQVAMGMMNKNLEIAPQLVIRAGYPFNVQVTKDLVFPGAY
jgi:type IV secretion system protein VirB10